MLTKKYFLTQIECFVKNNNFYGSSQAYELKFLQYVINEKNFPTRSDHFWLKRKVIKSKIGKMTKYYVT